MNIPEAVNELQDQCCVPNSIFLTKPYQARALGIEALKRLQKIRSQHLSGDFYPLPGETKE